MARSDVTDSEIAQHVDKDGLFVATQEERIFVATQWQLMWWRFRKHKLAIAGAVVIFSFYLVALFVEFLAPHDPNKFDSKWTFFPPQKIHFRDETRFYLRPFVYGVKFDLDPETFESVYKDIPSEKYPIHFLVHGDPYRMWGLFDADLHLIGTEDDKVPLFLLGTDRMGRDMLSRIIYGTRISLSVGLAGVFLNMVLGILIGGISGYYGGTLDLAVQRVIEFLRSMPSIPLWLALSAALPPAWPALRIYFFITLILSLIGWTGLAQVVRGRFLSLKNEDFVMAAQLCGSSELRIVIFHMVPSFLSHLIASLTLAVPGMILGETTLSFLGVGLRPPVVSWGVALKEAQSLRNVALAPWLLLPGVFVVLAVLSFNFVGDGLRDAADPYAR
jgi:peptide/nickel transport system permease protein